MGDEEPGRGEMGEERDRTRGIPPWGGGGGGGRGERLRETVSLLRPTPLAMVVVVVRAPLVADEQIRVMGGRNIDLG